MIADAEKFKAEDEENKLRIEAKSSLESYVWNIKTTLEDQKLKEHFESDANKEEYTLIKNKVDEVQEWIDNNTSVDKSEYDNKQKELETIWNLLIKKVYEAAGVPDNSSGIPEMPGMPEMPNVSPEQMKQAQEMFANMSQEEKDNLMKQLSGSMPKSEDID